MFTVLYKIVDKIQMKSFVEAAMAFLTDAWWLMLMRTAEGQGLEHEAYISETGKYKLAKQMSDLCILMRPRFPSDHSFRRR